MFVDAMSAYCPACIIDWSFHNELTERGSLSLPAADPPVFVLFNEPCISHGLKPMTPSIHFLE